MREKILNVPSWYLKDFRYSLKGGEKFECGHTDIQKRPKCQICSPLRSPNKPVIHEVVVWKNKKSDNKS